MVPVPSPFTSVRVRLTLWYVLILALILATFSGALYVTEQNYLVSQLDRDLQTHLEELGSTYDSHTGRLAAIRVTKGPYSWLFCKGTVDAASGIALLLTPQGQVIQVCGPARLAAQDLRAMRKVTQGAAPVPQGQDQVVGQRDVTLRFLPSGAAQQVSMRFASLPLASGRRIGAMLVVGMVSTVQSQMAALLLRLGIAAPILLLLCAAGGYWLADRALRPVQAITRAAQDISETDLGRRLNLQQRDELGALAATFDHMLDRLEAAFKRQRQFTADASHELRTPLSIADLEATRALAQPRTAEAYRDAITIMQQENRYMAHLVDDLLTLARADSGQTALQYEHVDLGEIVLDAAERLAPLAQETGLSVTIGPLPEAPVRGDRRYLTQLITNIVANALTYGAGFGTRVRIDAGHQNRDDTDGYLLLVTDDGPGIPAEHLPHVCERFYRVDSARTHTDAASPDGATTRPTGSGLGLAISQWIVDAHGGDLQIRSEVSHGTNVEIWLPVQPRERACDGGPVGHPTDVPG